jgi:ATP-dependent helicase/DNAse subunit B
MFYQVNYEKRRDLVQDVIDRLTRLDAEQGAQYLQELEALHEKFNINLNMDTQGVRYYPTNKHLTK